MHRLVRSGTTRLWIGLGILGAAWGPGVDGQEAVIAGSPARFVPERARLRAGDRDAFQAAPGTQPRLVGRAGGMTAYAATEAQRRFFDGITSRGADGGGADITELLLIQDRFLDSQCSFPEECGGPCNVVQMLWVETLENTQGVDITVDGRLLGTLPGLPAAQLPGVNGVVIQNVPAGFRSFQAEDAAGTSFAMCAMEVLDAQPFGDVSDVECEQGAVAEDGTCEVSVSWSNPGPFAEEIGIIFDGNFLGATPGSRLGVGITEVPAGEHCVEVFGLRAASACAIYRGCFLLTCCEITCERPACAPPRDLLLCQAAYGPAADDNVVRAAWTNGETTYAGITALLDDVALGSLPGDSVAAVIGELAPGPHTIGFQGDCGPDGLSAITEGDIVIRETSPHPRPITEAGIACSYEPDPDGEGEATSTTTATWTNEDPSLFIDVYVLAGTDAFFIASIVGSETEVTLTNTEPTDRIALQFFAFVDGDCYGSPPLACGATVPPTNTYIQGLCNGTGTLLQISSAVFFLNYLFVGGPDPPCLKACDSNGDGNGDLSDGVFVLAYLFLGGPPPPSWVDSTGDVEPDPTCVSAGVGDDCAASHEACR